MPTEEELRDGFNLGEWEVLPGKGVLRRGEQEERPEPKVFEVLMALATRDTNLVTKQQLIEEVWEGRPTSDEPIARCVSQLRGHLDDRQTPHQYIETLQRRGYRLKQRVELHRPATPEPAEVPDVAPGPSSRMWKVVAAVLAVGFIAIAAVTWIKPILDPPPVRSIGVMPFENLSGDEEDEYLVLGFKQELVQILQGMDDYTVKPVRGEYIQLESNEIAEILGVENLLFGSLRRNGDDLKINYQISKDGSVIDGDDIEGTVDDLFSLQESLALMVRDDLVGKSSQILIKSRPSDSKAYDSYMRGVYALEHRGADDNLILAIELFLDAIRLDPNYGPPYLALATAYALMPDYHDAPQLEYDSLALGTINAGIVADSNLEDAGGSIWGFVYHKQNRWLESEEAHLRAINADVLDSNAFNWYSRMLASVGRLDDSLRMALAGLEIDPSSPLLNSRVAMTYAWLQDYEHALEYYERANDLGWGGIVHNVGYAFMLLQNGDAEKALNTTRSAVQSDGQSTRWVEPFFNALTDIDDPAKAQAAIEALDEAAVMRPLSPFIDFAVRGMLGDRNGAMQVAKLLEQDGEAFEMDLLFIPELSHFRQHPDFMPLLGRLGITDYWLSRGCVWDGDKVNCPSN